MPNHVDKATLRRVHAAAGKLREQGYSYQTVNKWIREKTGGEIHGIATLEKRLGVPVESEGMAKGLARQAVEGATFGFADELKGLGAAIIPGGEDFGSARAAWEQQSAAFREEHPVASIAANIAGGAVLPGAAGASLIRSGGGNLAQRLVGAAGAGAGLGAIGGGLEGAGRAEGGLGERAKAGGLGALIGGAAGGALGVGGTLLGPPARKVVGKVTDRFRPGAAKDIARRDVTRAIERAGLTPEEAIEQAARAPGGSVVADIDPSIADAARGAANVAPGLRRMGGPLEAVYDRHANVGERMARALRTATGIAESGMEAEDMAKAGRRLVSENFYKPIEQANPVIRSASVRDRIQEIADSELVGAKARRLARRALRRGDDIGFKEAQEVRSLIGDDLAGQIGPETRETLSGLRQRLTADMEDAIPDFRAANVEWTNASRRLDAIEAGQKAFNQPAERVARYIDELPTQEAKNAFRAGYLDKVERSLREVETGGGTASKIMRMGPELRDRMRALFPDDASYAHFLESVETERRWAITYNILTGNSTTARQLIEAAGMEVAPNMGQLRWQIAGMMFDDEKLRMQAAEEIGRALLSQSGDAAKEVLEAGAFQGARRAAAGVSAGRKGARLLGDREDEEKKNRRGLLR